MEYVGEKDVVGGRTKNKVKLTEDEKRQFDNISFDEIQTMSDLKRLYKLEKYMRDEGFPQTADAAKMKILDLGGRNPDQNDPANRALAEAELKEFRSTMASWEENMEKTEKMIQDEKIGRGGISNNHDGRPPIRQAIHSDKENQRRIDNKPLSKEEARRMKDRKDLRSGRDYYDKWANYTEKELKELEAEEQREKEESDKRLKEARIKEEELQNVDDGGSGLKAVYSAMCSMTPAERAWQSAREKEKGNEMFKAKEYANAINAYSLSLKLNPGVASLHTNRAAAYLKVKRYEDAAQDCTWALDIEPGNFKALLRRGAARVEMSEEGSLEGAVQDIEAALEQEPENKELRALHERALRMVRQYVDKQDAKRMSRVLIEEVDDDDQDEEGADVAGDKEGEVVVASSSSTPANVVPAVEDASQPSPTPPTEATKRILIEEEDPEDGDGETDGGVDGDEADSEDESEEKTLEQLAEEEKVKGNQCFAKGEYKEAEKFYTNSLELFPANVPVLSNRAKCYLKMRKWVAAEDDADVAIAIDPTFIKAYHSRGTAKAGLGRKAEAIVDLQKVVNGMADASSVREEVRKLQKDLDRDAYIPARPPGKAMIAEVDSDEDDGCVSSPATDTGKAMERERRIQQTASSALARRAAIVSEEERRKEAKAAKRRSRAELKAAKAKSAELLALKKASELAHATPAAAIPPAPPSPVRAPIDQAAQQTEQAERLKEEGNACFRAGNMDESIECYTLSLEVSRTAGVFTNRSAAYLKVGKASEAEADATAALELDSSHIKAYHRRALARRSLGKYAQALEDLEVVAAALPNNTTVLNEVQELKLLVQSDTKSPVTSSPVSPSSTLNAHPAPTTAPATPCGTKGPPKTPAPAKGRRIAIEESDEDSEDDTASSPAPCMEVPPVQPTLGSQSQIAGKEATTTHLQANESFIASDAFTGARPGCVFKLGQSGLGYYVDDMQQKKIKPNKEAGSHAQAVAAPAGATPQVAVALKDSGNTLFQAGKVEEAVKLYTQSIQAAPTAAAHSNRAAAHLKLCNWQEAESDATAAIRLEPGHVKAHHRRAQARRHLGQTAAALEDLELVSKALPANRGLAEEVVALREEVARQRAEDECTAPATACQPQVVVAPAPHTQKGRRMVIEEASEEPEYSSGPPTPAAKPGPQPKSVPIHEEKDTTKVEDSEVPKTSSTEAPGPVRRRVVIEEEKDSDEEVAESTPDVAPDVHACPQPTTSAPLTPSANPSRTRVVIEEEDSEDEEEENAQSSSAKGEAGSALIAEQLKEEGNVFFKNGDMDRAVERYTMSLEHYPNCEFVLCNRSAAYLKKGNLVAALQDGDAAVRANPRHTKAFHRRGAARRAAGDLPGALEDFLKVQAELPGNKQVQADIVQLKQDIALAEKAAPKITRVVETSTEEKAVAAAAATADKYLERLPPPKSSVEFERACKALAKKPDLLANYIESIPLKSYPGVFKDSINANILKVFISSIKDMFLPNGKAAVAYGVLEALCSVRRFSMAVMLIPAKDKKSLIAALTELQQAGHDCTDLRKFYKL